VNANVAALYAYLGEQKRSSYKAAITTIEKGVKLTKASILYQRSLTPYYSHAMELLYVIRRAYRNGASGLKDSLSFLEMQSWKDEDSINPFPKQRPICCNDWGKPIWISPVLQTVRQLRAVCCNKSHAEVSQ